MKNNATKIGDLVCLNKKGVDFFEYKMYHRILASYGIVVQQNKVNAKVWWMTVSPTALWVAKKYLKKMNKR